MHLPCMNARRASQPLEVSNLPRSYSSDLLLAENALSKLRWPTVDDDVKTSASWTQFMHLPHLPHTQGTMKDCSSDSKQGSSKSFSGVGDVARGFQSRLRRASTSLKTSLQASSSVWTRTTHDASELTPKPNSVKRRASEMVPRPFQSDMFEVDHDVKENRTPSFSSHIRATALSSTSLDAPLADQAPGAAARAWAAKENERLGVSRRDSNQASAQTSSARESGINLCLDQSSSPDENLQRRESQLCRRDPFDVLPTEIQTHLLSFLDADSLRQATQVSRRWHDAESDQLIWREAFLRRYHYNSAIGRLPAPVGGRGIGKDFSLKEKDWKKMYKARTHLDRNWDAGVATAIYLQGHGDSVYCVQFDEDKIITGSRDRTIRFWDINTYKCTKVIAAEGKIAQDIEYAQRNDEPPTGGSGLTIFPNPLPRMPDPALYHTPRDYHEASILCLQYDKEIMVTGSSDHSLIVWDMATHQPIRRLQHHTSGVLDVAFDDEKIVSCSKDTTICIWERSTGRLLQQLSGHQGPVNALQLRGNLVVSASGEGCAKLLNLNVEKNADGSLDCNAKCVKEFWSNDRGLACVEFSDDCRYILAGGNDQVVYKFDTQTGEAIDKFEGHVNLVRSLYLDGSNGRVVSGSYDMSLRVWDYETGKIMMHLPNWTTSWMLSAKSDYRRIVSTSQDGRVLIMDFGYDVPDIEMLGSRL